MKFAQARKFALSFRDVSEEPHFDRTSFRINGKIFATAKPPEDHINIFVGDEQREPALALYPEYVAKLLWGGKVVGLQVALAKASPTVVKALLSAAWSAKATPKKRGR